MCTGRVAVHTLESADCARARIMRWHPITTRRALGSRPPLSDPRNGDRSIQADVAATRVARVVGVVFLVAGSVKFAAYGWELGNFRRFGLPVAPAWVLAAGVIEMAAGALLVGRRAVVPAALALAATMAVAIAVSGVAHGDIVPSLTLAPALLVACLFIAWRACQGTT